MQTRSNSGLVEDPASGQVLRGDNRSAEGSFCRTIPKALQGPAGSDVPPVGKGVQLLDGQKAPKNSGAMGVEDLIEVDAPPDNEKSGEKDEIAIEIERLKKEQKKAQMRTKLHCLKKHKVWRFVKTFLNRNLMHKS